MEWDAMGGKVQDIKAREKEGKGRTASPANSPARYPALPPGLADLRLWSRTAQSQPRALRAVVEGGARAAGSPREREGEGRLPRVQVVSRSFPGGEGHRCVLT